MIRSRPGTWTVDPCLDSPDLARLRRAELRIARDEAARIAAETLEAIKAGRYISDSGKRVEWADSIEAAKRLKVSIPPEAPLPSSKNPRFGSARVQVRNETTLAAARALAGEGCAPLALNFANGEIPGGGFLFGACAQEESLCRASALFAALVDDPMYEAHRRRPDSASSHWAILSPNVPVFRDDDGRKLEEPWPLSFVSSAAPVAHSVGVRDSARLMDGRIRRILDIAAAYGYDSLVLGAWGCGAFGNSGEAVARSFVAALAADGRPRFRRVVFAIADWSEDRGTLGPFRDAVMGLR